MIPDWFTHVRMFHYIVWCIGIIFFIFSQTLRLAPSLFKIIPICLCNYLNWQTILSVKCLFLEHCFHLEWAPKEILLTFAIKRPRTWPLQIGLIIKMVLHAFIYMKIWNKIYLTKDGLSFVTIMKRSYWWVSLRPAETTEQ